MALILGQPVYSRIRVSVGYIPGISVAPEERGLKLGSHGALFRPPADLSVPYGTRPPGPGASARPSPPGSDCQAGFPAEIS